MAAVRDGKEAVALARQACELDGWKHSASIDTLAAAACAEDDDFEAAVKYQQQALSILKPADKSHAEAQQRLTSTSNKSRTASGEVTRRRAIP